MDIFTFDEHQKAPARLADFLMWSTVVKEGVILNKDGAFQSTVIFRGHDMDSSTPEEIHAISLQMNGVLSRMGSNWCIHVESRRRPAMDYPDRDWPNAAAWLIDAERRFDFEEEGRHFENDYFITLSYLTPTTRNARLQEFMFDDDTKETTNDSLYEDQLRNFETTVDNFVNSLRAGLRLPLARRLTSEETLSYLNSCVSNRIQRVRVPDCPVNLDYMLANEPLVGGMAPRLGDQHLRTLAFREFPGETMPGVFDVLNKLPMSYRFVQRYLPLDYAEGEKLLKSRRKHWYSAREGLMSILMSAVAKSGPKVDNAEAEMKAADADLAVAENAAGYVNFGYFTPTITLKGATEAEVTEKIRIVQAEIERLGYVTNIEDMNAVEAWLGSLPGHAYTDTRRPVVSSRNVAHIAPLSAIWGGPTRNEHFDAPPLMMTKAAGGTPFRLDNFVGDVGHMGIFGPTGTGKSVLLNTIATQFQGFQDAQVYMVDVGGSSRCTTLCNEGQFFDLGDPDSLAFQPLHAIDDMQERQWAHEWILYTLLETSDVNVTPERKEAVWTALTTLSASPKEQRTLGMLRGYIQDDDIKAALKPFTKASDPHSMTEDDGPYAYLLDAQEESLSYSAWQSFELESLMHMKQAVPAVLEYLFHRLGQRFTGKPTMLILDEAWLFLDSPRFADFIRRWLKTLRKQNVAVVFATQQLSDIEGSHIANAVFENCPVNIFLPNPRATNNRVRQSYEGLDLNERQILNITHAVPKRDYYFVSTAGCRLFQLGLRRGALRIVGAASKADHEKIDHVLAEHGRADFAENWLRANNLADEAGYVREFNAARQSAPIAAQQEEQAHAIAAE